MSISRRKGAPSKPALWAWVGKQECPSLSAWVEKQECRVPHPSPSSWAWVGKQECCRIVLRGNRSRHFLFLLRRRKRQKNGPNHHQHSRSDQKPLALARNLQPLRPHRHRVRKARPRYESDHAAMFRGPADRDEHKDTHRQIETHHHCVARIGSGRITQAANQRKDRRRKEQPHHDQHNSKRALPPHENLLLLLAQRYARLRFNLLLIRRRS